MLTPQPPHTFTPPHPHTSTLTEIRHLYFAACILGALSQVVAQMRRVFLTTYTLPEEVRGLGQDRGLQAQQGGGGEHV